MWLVHYCSEANRATGQAPRQIELVAVVDPLDHTQHTDM